MTENNRHSVLDTESNPKATRNPKGAKMKSYIYIMTNKKNGTLYIGVTSDIVKRVYEHKNKLTDGFTKKYNLEKLVYYEIYDDIKEAITREKQLKNWKRDWKLELINKVNSNWDDLYNGIL
jgi:putative endonuclease